MKNLKSFNANNKFAAHVCLWVVMVMIGLSMLDLPHWLKREPQTVEQCK